MRYTILTQIILILLFSLEESKMDSPKECYEEITEEERFTETVITRVSRIAKMKTRRKERYVIKYFQEPVERVVRRNITRVVSICCPGYDTFNDTCILHKVTGVTKIDEPSAAMKSVMLGAPILMLLIMFFISVVVVYRLYFYNRDSTGKIIKMKVQHLRSGPSSGNNSVPSDKDLVKVPQPDLYFKIDNDKDNGQQYEPLNNRRNHQSTISERLYEDI